MQYLPLIQDDYDPEIEIEVELISHAFLLLAADDADVRRRMGNDVVNFIRDANAQYQPRICKKLLNVEFVTLETENKLSSGFPNFEGIGEELISHGLEKSHSLLVNHLAVDLELSGSRHISAISRFTTLPAPPTRALKALVGFAFRDDLPRIISPRKDGCIPKYRTKHLAYAPIAQGDDDPPIEIDLEEITHTFIALTHYDKNLCERMGRSDIESLNRYFQPKIWNNLGEKIF